VRRSLLTPIQAPTCHPASWQAFFTPSPNTICSLLSLLVALCSSAALRLLTRLYIYVLLHYLTNITYYPLIPAASSDSTLYTGEEITRHTTT
jgi:predicted Abi (CAAX) family protease